MPLIVRKTVHRRRHSVHPLACLHDHLRAFAQRNPDLGMEIDVVCDLPRADAVEGFPGSDLDQLRTEHVRVLQLWQLVPGLDESFLDDVIDIARGTEDTAHDDTHQGLMPTNQNSESRNIAFTGSLCQQPVRCATQPAMTKTIIGLGHATPLPHSSALRRHVHRQHCQPERPR